MTAEPHHRRSEYPRSQRLFTEADLREAAENTVAFFQGDVGDEAVNEYLDGWLCEPYKSAGAQPPEEAVERVARAIYLDRNPGGDWNAPRPGLAPWLRCAREALRAALEMTEAQQRAAVGL